MAPSACSSQLDRDLLLAFRAGDRLAFDRLIEARWTLVWRTVSRYSRSRFEREDLFQEVWIHVFEKREHLDPGRLDRFDAWLARLARNRTVDLLRARRGGRSEPVQIDTERLVEAAPGPEASARQAELGEAVEVFSAGLDEARAAFFRLHFVEGRTLVECASHLGVPVHRCKYWKRVLLRRARRHGPLLAALGRREG